MKSKDNKLGFLRFLLSQVIIENRDFLENNLQWERERANAVIAGVRTTRNAWGM